MQINAVTQIKVSNQPNFQGKVDKSVTKNLKKFYAHYHDTKVLNMLNLNHPIDYELLRNYKTSVQDVTKKLNKFMKKCHEKSILKFDVGDSNLKKGQERSAAKLYIKNKTLPKNNITEYATSNEFIDYKSYKSNGEKQLLELLRMTNEFLEKNTPEKCDKTVLGNALQKTLEKSSTMQTKNQKRNILTNLKSMKKFQDEVNYSEKKYNKYKNLIIENLKQN